MRHAKKPSPRRPSGTGPSASADSPSTHRAHRPPTHKGKWFGLLALGGVTTLTLVVVYGSGGPARSATEPGDGARKYDASPLPEDTPSAQRTPSKPAAPPKPSLTPTASTSHPVPQSGTGVFTTAAASGGAVGKGDIRRYKVEVEGGSGVSAKSAAGEIDGILGDPRGWTADGHDGFQLVSSGPYDFEVKIATPDTVDRICGAAGLHTHGEVNCDVGDQVIVNLKRWKKGSPQFPGSLHDYRALIINHEVGHRIGHGHETCPGPGLPAPAMMQQIDGLHGCRANAWPYDSHGKYLGGPHVS
ncbi:DUF3152 domain-containing protein [Streptomyces sp. NPDC059398]|uniref:DUF3152 domain-containing protein n=1 Tax=Streptomyces sp. NPDC059398 TaxID=3346820 RepID=UPI0036D17824